MAPANNFTLTLTHWAGSLGGLPVFHEGSDLSRTSATSAYRVGMLGIAWHSAYYRRSFVWRHAFFIGNLLRHLLYDCTSYFGRFRFVEVEHFHVGRSNQLESLYVGKKFCQRQGDMVIAHVGQAKAVLTFGETKQFEDRSDSFRHDELNSRLPLQSPGTYRAASSQKQ